MICPSRAPLPYSDRPVAPKPRESSPSCGGIYDSPFWWAYASNLLVSVGVAVLYRYADFVTFLGGSELHLGWIVGIGMVGSLLVRLLLGSGIDQYGPRWIWLGSLGLLVATCLAHLSVHSYQGPAIYLLRIGFCSALAGVFGASLTFISNRAPVARIAEMLGMLGTSGFLGMVLGAQLSDLILGPHPLGRGPSDRMFLAAGLLALAAMVAAGRATRWQVHVAPRRRPRLARVVRRYYPGTVVLVSVAMGFGFGLPTIFLRTHAADLGIARIGLFFTVYAATAITTRLLTRRWSERFGPRPIVLLGLGLLIASQPLFLLVEREWQLMLPSLTYGVSHALLFPAAFAEGCTTFPIRYRGLGMSLMLAAYDLGQLIGAPLAGAVIHASHRLGLPSYPTMYLSVSVILALVGGAYVFPRRARLPRRRAAAMLPLEFERPTAAIAPVTTAAACGHAIGARHAGAGSFSPLPLIMEANSTPAVAEREEP